MRKNRLRNWIPVLAALLTASPAAHAGGILVGEAGSQAMERAGAFVAKSDDPTALSVNPAGLARLRKFEIYLGANLLHMPLKYTRSGVYPQQAVETQPTYVGSPYPEMVNDDNTQAVPYLALTARLGNLAFGAGFYAPSGMPNRDFKCQVQDFCQVEDNGAPAPNRYDVVKQQAIIGFPSVAVAYRVHPKLDLGVRASWGFGGVKARNFPWALPNKGENPKAEGDFDVDVHDNFIFSFGAGALFRPTDNLEFGASYTSEKSVNNKGTGNASLGPQVNPLGDPQVFIEPNPVGDEVEVALRCEEGGTISALKSCINFKLPMLAQIGGRYIFRDGKGGERADVELDVRWENWERASDDEVLVNGRDTLLLNTLRPVISRHGYDDVWSVRLGGSYKIDMGDNALSLRGGFAYDTAAAPRSWTRLDKDGRARALFGGGLAYDFGRWRVDAGFAYVAEGQIVVTDVDLGDNPSVPDRVQPDPLQPSNEASAAMYHPINAGTYTSSYLVGSLGITVGF